MAVKTEEMMVFEELSIGDQFCWSEGSEIAVKISTQKYSYLHDLYPENPFGLEGFVVKTNMSVIKR